MPDLPIGYIVHSIPGRLRIRVPDKRRDLAFFTRATREMALCPGVNSVTANALTGSLLITHDTDDRMVTDHALSQQIFAAESARPAASPVATSERWLAALADANQRFSDASGGRGDLAGVVAGALIILAAVQFARGQIGISAITASWYALHALSLGREWRSDGKRSD